MFLPCSLFKKKRKKHKDIFEAMQFFCFLADATMRDLCRWDLNSWPAEITWFLHPYIPEWRAGSYHATHFCVCCFAVVYLPGHSGIWSLHTITSIWMEMLCFFWFGFFPTLLPSSLKYELL